MFLMNQDPRWLEISASLRQNKLYVKMSKEKTQVLVNSLVTQHKDLSSKETFESEKAFVFSSSADDWTQDLPTLKSMVPSALVLELILAIEAGLRNEAQWDWISRVGGPQREDADALANLVLDPEDFILQ